MFLILLLVGGVAVVMYVWSRTSRLKLMLDDLRQRIAALEQARRAIAMGAPPVRLGQDTTEEPQTSAPPPTAREWPSPTPPPVIPPESRLWTQPPPSVGLTPSRQAGRPDLQSATDSLETQIGSRWLLYIGVASIVVGVSYFEKLAFESGWIGETARVVQGAVAGLVLIYAGTRFDRAGYSLYGHAISGGGAAVLYISTYAAFTLYHLIGRPLAFALMCVITVLAAWMADRQRAQGLALLAVGGGFATPFLLPSVVDTQVALFTYDAVLIAGTMYLAHRRLWPTLNAVSYGFAFLTVLGWAVRFYTPSKYLVTELFLTLFLAMFLYILRENRRSSHALAGLVEAVLWTAPLAYYLASIAILSPHSIPLLVFVLGGTTASCMLGARIGGAAVRLVVLLAAAAPFLAWISGHTGRTWLTAGLITVTAIYVIHLLAHFEATLREGHQLTRADIAALHLNGLIAYGGANWLIEAVNVSATAPIAFMFAFWHGAMAFWLATRRRDHALHFATLAFTLLAVAVAIQFDGAWVTMGWAAEGAAVMWLGLRQRREWLRLGGFVLFALASVQLLGLQFAAPTINQVVFLNRRAGCGAFLVALAYATAWIHHRRDGSQAHAFEVGLALVTAQVLTLSLLTSEIRAYWALGAPPGGTGRFGRELMLSITWAVYATGLIVAGIRQRYAPIRYTGIVVFGLTILKVFTVDLAELDQIYRVSSVLSLGVLLLLTSYLYHRFRQALE